MTTEELRELHGRLERCRKKIERTPREDTEVDVSELESIEDHVMALYVDAMRRECA